MKDDPQMTLGPKEKVTMQAYLLTATNDEERNAFHLACNKGSLKLLEFILKLSEKLNLRAYIINSEDDLSYTPLYLLCLRGYDKKFDAKA